MYDLTIDNLLPTVPTSIAGLQRPQAYPYLTDDDQVYALANFEQAANFSGHSMLDWEPSVLEHTTGPGTVGVVADAGGSIVTITGGTFPNYDGHSRYKHRFYVNGDMYPVASWTDSTHLRLVDTTLNVTSGASFKYARWLYREVDPKYAAPGEMEEAHDEFAHALSLVENLAQTNSARLGVYDFLFHYYRRNGDIIASTESYEQWQLDVETSVNYVTASGFTIADYIRRLGGKVWWTAYVPEEFLANEFFNDLWITRNQRVMETLRQLKVPNAPVFRRQVIDGADVGEWVPDDFMLRCIGEVEAYQPGEWAFWGTADEYTESYADFLSAYTTSLPKGQAAIRHLLRNK